MATSIDLQPPVSQVNVTGDMLTVTLVDGRIIIVPTSWFSRLANAVQRERDDWRLMGDGEGIHWDALDEDISVPGLLGLPDL